MEHKKLSYILLLFAKIELMKCLFFVNIKIDIANAILGDMLI